MSVTTITLLEVALNHVRDGVFQGDRPVVRGGARHDAVFGA